MRWTNRDFIAKGPSRWAQLMHGLISDDTNNSTLPAVHDKCQSVAAKYSLVHLEGQKTHSDLFVPVDRKTLLR